MIVMHLFEKVWLDIFLYMFIIQMLMSYFWLFLAAWLTLKILFVFFRCQQGGEVLRCMNLMGNLWDFAVILK